MFTIDSIFDFNGVADGVDINVVDVNVDENVNNVNNVDSSDLKQ